MELDVDTFLTTVYCIVDELYQRHYAPHKPRRPGPRPEMSDSEVLTVTILAQWQQDRSERAFLKYAGRHWRGYFLRSGQSYGGSITPPPDAAGDGARAWATCSAGARSAAAG